MDYSKMTDDCIKNILETTCHKIQHEIHYYNEYLKSVNEDIDYYKLQRDKKISTMMQVIDDLNKAKYINSILRLCREGK